MGQSEVSQVHDAGGIFPNYKTRWPMPSRVVSGPSQSVAPRGGTRRDSGWSCRTPPCRRHLHPGPLGNRDAGATPCEIALSDAGGGLDSCHPLGRDPKVFPLVVITSRNRVQTSASRNSSKAFRPACPPTRGASPRPTRVTPVCFLCVRPRAMPPTPQVPSRRAGVGVAGNSGRRPLAAALAPQRGTYQLAKFGIPTVDR